MITNSTSFFKTLSKYVICHNINYQKGKSYWWIQWISNPEENILLWILWILDLENWKWCWILWILDPGVRKCQWILWILDPGWQEMWMVLVDLGSWNFCLPLDPGISLTHNSANDTNVLLRYASPTASLTLVRANLRARPAKPRRVSEKWRHRCISFFRWFLRK